FGGRIVRVAPGLRGIRAAKSGVFPGVGAGTGGHAVVTVGRKKTRGVGHLWPVTARPLVRREDVCDAGGTRGVGGVALGSLRHIPDPERIRARRDRGEGDDREGRNDREAGSPEHPILPYICGATQLLIPAGIVASRNDASTFADAKALAFASARSSASRGDRVHRPRLPRAAGGNARDRLAVDARVTGCALRGARAARRGDDRRAVRGECRERALARATRDDRAAPRR